MIFIHVMKNRCTLIEQSPQNVDQQAIILCHCLLTYLFHMPIAVCSFKAISITNQSAQLLYSYCLGISLFCFELFFFLVILFFDLLCSRFCSKFQYLLKVKLTVTSYYSQLHIMYLNCIYTSWRAIGRLIMSQLYCLQYW